MFVNERFIKVPYQEYKVSLKHAAIRKLTVIEWSLLRITDQFGSKPEYKDFTLDRFYEEVLGMDNCEMLLKPCVHQLIDLEMIEIEGFTETSMVTRIKLGEIKITDKGSKSLRDGYLLGQMQNADETAYLDMVSDQMLGSIQDYADRDIDHRAKAINKGRLSSVAFPVERFIRDVNEGRLFKEKYYDSRRWVDSAVCAEDKAQWYTTLLLLEQTRDNELKCNFPVNDEILDLLRNMVSCPFECKERAAIWGDSDPLPEKGSFGSKMLRPVLSSLEYSENVFMPEELYLSVRSENPDVLGGKTVFIMGSKEFALDDLNGLIYLPVSFDNTNLIYYDDKKDAYNLFVKHDSLDGNPLDVYFIQDTQVAADLLSSLFPKTADLAEKNPEIISVFAMPVFKVKQIELNRLYAERLSCYESFKEAIQFAARVSATSRRLHANDINPDITSDYVRKLLPCDDIEALITDLRYAYQYYYNLLGPTAYFSLLTEAAELYSGADRIAATEMIAELAETYCGGKYDKTVFADTMSEKVSPLLHADDYDALYGKVCSDDEERREALFGPYADYLSFRDAYRAVLSLLPEYVWENEYTKDELLGKLIECPNILMVNECVDRMIDVSDHRTIPGCCFFRDNQMRKNADLLKEILGLFILPEGVPAPIYIIDTCAFVHTPEILDYFKEDEIVRIPFRVLRELDKHKDNKSNDAHIPAAKACKSIEQHVTKARLGGLLTFDLESQDYPDLLPVGFTYADNNRLSPDNLILSCAFRYKAFRPTILTDDTNFRNISRSQGIAVKAWKDFIEERGGRAERSSSASKSNMAGTPITTSTAAPEKPYSGAAKPVAVPVKPAAAAPVQPKSLLVISDNPEAREKLRQEWLNRSIEELTAPEIGVASKVTKALQAADIRTIRKLTETSDATIRQRIKAVSLRTGAIDAKKKFEQFISTVKIDEIVTVVEKPELPPEISSESSADAAPEQDSEVRESDAGNVSDHVPLTKMGFSIRTYNCLHRVGYSVSGEFIHLPNDQLLKIRNLGQKGVDEILAWVAAQRDNDQAKKVINEEAPAEQDHQSGAESVAEGGSVGTVPSASSEKSGSSELSDKWKTLTKFAQNLGMQPERMERSILFKRQLEDFIQIAEKEKPKLAQEMKACSGMVDLIDIIQREKIS